MAILIMLAIFFASGTPGNDLPDLGRWDLFTKKGGHLLGYALLAVGYLRGLANGRPVTRRLWFLAVLLSGIYATSDEFHQYFIAGRSCSIYDVMIDTVGAVFGASTWTWIRSSITAREGSGSGE
jgi:VanZ family protein